ncbi:MAG: sulfotransferase, partial [Steroidobacter sp.]
SGSTLLFETLAVTPQFQTLGGEAHWLVEGIEQLRPGEKDVDSNRLTEQHFTNDIAEKIINTISTHLQQAHISVNQTQTIRLLEKTPKNALRIPFFNRIFPDALFIFLWRAPQSNISSIMEAWRSGKWITYNGLPGTSSPWSLLLPPGWQFICNQPLENIAAYQWECTNRMVLSDLAALDSRRWCALNYEAFVKEPRSAIERLCNFMEVDFDAALSARVSAALPLSRFTHTPPSPEKWRINAEAIERIMPYVTVTWNRLKALNDA